MGRIKKVIFPVGGFGTRFLPVTKSMPKEMLPIVNVPLIQYAFEEAREAGAEQFIFVTGRHKNSIHNHFDHAFELESVLHNKLKVDALAIAKDCIVQPGSVIFIRQQRSLGLGHAVWCARNVIDDDPFAVILADELFIQQDKRLGLLGEMLNIYERNYAQHNSNLSLISISPVSNDDVHRYGIIEVISKDKDEYGGASLINDVPEASVYEISNMIEKPSLETAPSNLAITGRYVLHPAIFQYIERLFPYIMKETTEINESREVSQKEIDLTMPMSRMLKEGYKYHGVRIDGTRLDCGHVLGFLEANIRFGLRDQELRNPLKKALYQILEDEQ